MISAEALDDLVYQIKNRELVPVVGPELLVVEWEGRERRLYDVIADHLIDKLRIDRAALKIRPTLSEVAAEYLVRQPRGRGKLNLAIQRFLDETSFEVPTPLRRLAEITDFSLFVSTTFDGLLEHALNEVRYGGEDRTIRGAYAIRTQADDMPDDIPELHASSEAHVYRLFGRISKHEDQVILDRDALEFFSRLHEPRQRPQNLFDLLRDQQLLILGCNYPDWLTRFFVRLLWGAPAENRTGGDWVADRETRAQSGLTAFLRSGEIEYLRSGDSVDLVRRLHEAWRAATPTEARTEKPKVPQGCVFLSFSSADRRHVARLRDQLKSNGLTVWFDEERILYGQDYASVIAAGIEKAQWFVPCISKNTADQEDRYFPVEWEIAVKQVERIGINNICPVILDSSSPHDLVIPPAFKRVRIADCPNGNPPNDFVQRLQKSEPEPLPVS